MAEMKNAPLKDTDIVSARQTLQLVRSQLQARPLDLPFLQDQLDKLASFIERADAEHRQFRREGRFESLYNVSRSIGESLDLQVVLDDVMDAVIQLSEAERGFLVLRNDDGGVQVAAARGLDQQTLSSDKFAFSHTIINGVLDTGQPILTTNAAEDPRFAGQQSIMTQALRSIMASPLRIRGRVIGVAYVDNRAHIGLFDQDDLVALETFTVQAAIAIENARLFSATDEALQRRVEELTQLRRIDQQLSESLNPRKIMLTALEWVCRLAGAEVGHVGQLMADSQSVEATYHYGLDIRDTQTIALESYYPEVLDVALKASPLYIEDTGDGHSVLMTPIKRDDRLICVVVLRRAGPISSEARDLVERVMVRAAVALENAQLYEKVREADKAKSEFVGIVAHDLKVPMTSILGYANLMLLDPSSLTPRHHEFIGKVTDTVRRMEALVADLADISRIETGHFYMDPTRVPVEKVVQEIRDATMTQIRARHHTYIEHIAPNLPDMHADYYRLIQVLTNLVSNAYKYTPDNGTITLTTQAVGDRVEFTVTDTGIGMTPQQVAMLGVKFWRADDDFTRAQPGTGLGFAITKALVELMGSSIYVVSEPGQGSSFSFSVASVGTREGGR